MSHTEIGVFCRHLQACTTCNYFLSRAPLRTKGLRRSGKRSKTSKIDAGFTYHTHTHIYTQMLCNDFALWIPQLRRNSIRQPQVVVDKISFFNIVTRLCLHPSCEMSPPPYFVIKKVEVTGFRICCFRLWGYIIIVPPNVRHNLKQLMDISSPIFRLVFNRVLRCVR